MQEHDDRAVARPAPSSFVVPWDACTRPWPRPGTWRGVRGVPWWTAMHHERRGRDQWVGRPVSMEPLLVCRLP